MRDNEFFCFTCGQMFEVMEGDLLEAQREHSRECLEARRALNVPEAVFEDEEA